MDLENFETDVHCPLSKRKLSCWADDLVETGASTKVEQATLSL